MGRMTNLTNKKGVVLDSVYVRKGFRQTSQMTAMATGIEQRRRGIKDATVAACRKKSEIQQF
jgi:hypothetical protein